MLRFSRVSASLVSTSIFVIFLSLSAFLWRCRLRHRVIALLHSQHLPLLSRRPLLILSLLLYLYPRSFILIFYPLLGCWLCVPHLSLLQGTCCVPFSPSPPIPPIYYIVLWMQYRSCWYCVLAAYLDSFICLPYPHSLLSSTTPQILN